MAATGLAPPTIIEDQIAEYRSSMDSISQFVQDECELGIDHSCSASQFYNAYRTWCLTVGKKPKTTTAFKKSLDQIQPFIRSVHLAGSVGSVSVHAS